MSWSDLFADTDERERLEWGVRPSRFTASPGTTGLLSFQRVDDWLRYGQLRYPQLRLSLPHGAVEPAAFTENRPYRGQVMSGCPDVAAIATQLAIGATLRLVGIEHVDEPFAALCARLTELFNAVVGIDAFYTPPGDDGLGAHFDHGEVFVLQVEGRKTWYLWDIPSGAEPRRLFADAKSDHVLELAPGDGLYLPAGTGHRAVAGPAGSLHLSVTVTPTSYRDVVRAWTEEFLATVPMMDRLPLFGDRLPPIAEILRGIAAAAQKSGPADLLATVDRHRPQLSDAPLIPGVRPPGTDAAPLRSAVAAQFPPGQ